MALYFAQHPGSQTAEVLVLLHHMEVVVRLNVEECENLIQQRAMLSAGENSKFHFRNTLQTLDDRSELYRFWTSSEGDAYSHGMSPSAGSEVLSTASAWPSIDSIRALLCNAPCTCCSMRLTRASQLSPAAAANLSKRRSGDRSSRADFT